MARKSLGQERSLKSATRTSDTPGSCQGEVALDQEPPSKQTERMTDRPGAQVPHITPAPYRARRRGARPLRGVLVLHSGAEAALQDGSHDLLSNLETLTTARAVAEALRQHLSLEVHLLPATRQSVVRQLEPYPPEDYLVFNLFEGLDGVTGEEGATALAVRALGYRVTGAGGSALALAVNKAETKALLASQGVLTPPWQVFASQGDVTLSALAGLDFPLIVKPLAEDSSLAIDREAVVADLESLRARVAYVVRTCRQPALVESFVDGREFNVALWGSPPEVLPLAEVDLGAFRNPHERIVSFAAKWQEDSFEYQHTPVQCPAQVCDDLAARIRATALQAWATVGCSGYARVDMRVQDDKVFVLEVNPNPSLAPDAGFARAARAAGFDYAQMILRVLSLAGGDEDVRPAQG